MKKQIDSFDRQLIPDTYGPWKTKYDYKINEEIICKNKCHMMYLTICPKVHIGPLWGYNNVGTQPLGTSVGD